MAFGSTAEGLIEILSQYLFDLVNDIGLLHISPGPFFLSDLSGLFISPCCDDDHPRLRLTLCRHFQYFPSIQFWHDQVGDDEVKMLDLGCLDGFSPILNRNDLIPFLGKGLGKRPSDQEFIIRNQDLARLNGRPPLDPVISRHRHLETHWVARSLLSPAHPPV